MAVGLVYAEKPTVAMLVEGENVLTQGGGSMIPLVERRKTEIAALCRHYGVRRLDIFGSAATGKFQDVSSDLDFIADFAEKGAGYADRYLDFAEALESLFGRPVDLMTERSIQNPYFRKSVEATRQTIYDRRSQEAAA
jgi:predicted nucleotidyltransferase